MLQTTLPIHFHPNTATTTQLRRTINPEMATRSFDLPTKDEQLQLRETRNLMSSGVLQLQMDEMLAETRVELGRKHSSNLKSWIDKLIKRLKTIETPESLVTPLWLRDHGMSDIFFRDLNTSVTFVKPSKIDQIGSFSSGVATNPFLNIDLAVQLPPDILDERCESIFFPLLSSPHLP
jgi:hypothetical protein